MCDEERYNGPERRVSPAFQLDELHCMHSRDTVAEATSYLCVQSSGEDLGTGMADLRLAQHQVATQYLLEGGIRGGLFG